MVTTRFIPPEILSEIFMWRCIWGKKLEEFENEDVITLTRVCKAWQRATMARPALWSMVLLQLDRPYDADDVQRVETWIARSGILPLDVHIRTGEEDLYAESTMPIPESRRAVMGMIAAFALRCRELYASFPAIVWNKLFVPPAVERVATRLPRLTKLELAIPHLPDLDVVAVIDFSACPRLATLMLESNFAGFRTYFFGNRDRSDEYRYNGRRWMYPHSSLGMLPICYKLQPHDRLGHRS